MKINAELVRTLRAERHWSQEQLAAACGVNLRTVQRLENTGKASLESVRALAAVFEVDPDDLILSARGPWSLAVWPLDGSRVAQTWRRRS